MIHGSADDRRQIVLCLARSNEIARDQLCTLMNQLIKRMLPIGSWFSPNDWASLDLDTLATFRDVFSVGFHVTLLEVGSESMHVLIIRQDCE